MIVTFGLGGNQIVLRGFGENATHKNFSVVESDNTEGVPIVVFALEGLAGILGSDEALPGVTLSLEGVPSRGPAQGGVWTETDQGGVWTEPPQQGAYTQDNSYIKEYKESSFFTKEGVPS